MGQDAQAVLLRADQAMGGATLKTLRYAHAGPLAQVNANHVSLLRSIERLKLDVDRILPLHGRIVPASELYAGVWR